MEKEIDRKRNITKKLIKQNLEKIIREGTVKIQDKVAKININSKESLRAAVKLSIINPFRTTAARSEVMKKELEGILEIYDEVFDEVYGEYVAKPDFRKITELTRKMNESSKIDTKKITEEVIESAKREYPTYDDRN